MIVTEQMIYILFYRLVQKSSSSSSSVSREYLVHNMYAGTWDSVDIRLGMIIRWRSGQAKWPWSVGYTDGPLQDWSYQTIPAAVMQLMFKNNMRTDYLWFWRIKSCTTFTTLRPNNSLVFFTVVTFTMDTKEMSCRLSNLFNENWISLRFLMQ